MKFTSRQRGDMRGTVRDRQQLLKILQLSAVDNPGPQTLQGAFPLKVPGSFLDRIRKSNPDDPLLRQILPVAEEDIISPGFTNDPVGEIGGNPAPGLIQKYHGRVLLITTGACAVHCRYCFRRHYPYDKGPPSRQYWVQALGYIRENTGIREVILSGGDPLTLADGRLRSLIGQLEDIPHLQWLRIHTRIPVVWPERVTERLIRLVNSDRLKTTVVIHANHPQEIGEDAAGALLKLHTAGIQMLNQSVLLRGINDNAGTLASLSERLYANHVLPYYLHMLDPVAGAGHFKVEETTARAIINSLRAMLPGYLVPRLVREIEGAPAKTPV